MFHIYLNTAKELTRSNHSEIRDWASQMKKRNPSCCSLAYGTRFLGIGVGGQDTEPEALKKLKDWPFSIDKVLPDTVNYNYPTEREKHILIPMILTYTGSTINF